MVVKHVHSVSLISAFFQDLKKLQMVNAFEKQFYNLQFFKFSPFLSLRSTQLTIHTVRLIKTELLSSENWNTEITFKSTVIWETLLQDQLKEQECDMTTINNSYLLVHSNWQDIFETFEVGMSLTPCWTLFYEANSSFLSAGCSAGLGYFSIHRWKLK